MNALLTKVITSERKGNFIVYCFYLVHVLGKGSRIRKAYEAGGGQGWWSHKTINTEQTNTIGQFSGTMRDKRWKRRLEPDCAGLQCGLDFIG